MIAGDAGGWGIVLKLSSVICHNMVLTGNNMPVWGEKGMLLGTDRLFKKKLKKL